MHDQAASWICAVSGLGAAGWRFWAAVMADINTRAATAAFRKLFAAGNLDRALKLSKAAPKSVFFRSIREALEVPYRAGDGASLFRETVQSRFDQKLAECLAPLQGWNWVSYAAMLAGLLAAMLGITSSPPVVAAIVMGAIAALLCWRNLLRPGRMNRAAQAGFAELIGDLVDARSGAPGAQPVADEHDSADESSDTLALVVTIAGHVQGTFTLGEGKHRIGRAADCEVPIKHYSLSRIHAQIDVSDRGAILSDMGSANGINRNGELVEGPCEISSGDILDLGEVRAMVVSSVPAKPPARGLPPPTIGPGLNDLDLRNGVCPLCQRTNIEERQAGSGQPTPWVCTSCGYTQLFSS